MRDFWRGILTSLISTILVDGYRKIIEINKYINQPFLTRKEKRYINSIKKKINQAYEEIIGDLIQECKALVEQKQPRWKVGYVVMRNGWELCIVFFQISLELIFFKEDNQRIR